MICQHHHTPQRTRSDDSIIFWIVSPLLVCHNSIRLSLFRVILRSLNCFPLCLSRGCNDVIANPRQECGNPFIFTRKRYISLYLKVFQVPSTFVRYEENLGELKMSFRLCWYPGSRTMDCIFKKYRKRYKSG
jgi:hypothetical protein